MPTMIFSAPSKFWRPLCVNGVRAETSVSGEQCIACVIPQVVEPDPPPPCGGTSTWQWQEVIEEVVVEGETVIIISNEWVLISNNCTGGGTAVAPGETGTTDETQTIACDCP